MAGLLSPFRAFRAPSLFGSSRPNVSSRYLGPDQSPFMFNWRPILREAQADTQEAWTRATAQVIDTLHTSGWLHGGLQHARGKMIDPGGLRLNLKPYAGVISSDPKLQAAWARDVEGRFQIYCDDPYSIDMGGRYNLGGLLSQGINQYFASGESVVVLGYDADRAGTSHGLKVNMLPSSRLTQANGPKPNTVQGVTLNPVTGAPTAYTFDHWNLASGSYEQTTVQARDAMGRPIVLHMLDNAASAVRGITPLAPALRVVKQFDQLQDATLTTALMQTIFAATVEADAPTEDMLRALQTIEEQDATDGDNPLLSQRKTAALADMEGAPLGSFLNLMEARSSWYKNTNIDLGKFGKIAHLFPGEKLTFNRANIPGGDYKTFSKMLLREISQCAGITSYELDGDFDGFTYTTAKMATDLVWPLNLWRRAHIPARTCQGIFEAWLEEDILRGNTRLPGGIQQFHAQRQLICRADWRGPPRPTADELKTAKAYQVLRAEGWQSTESIAAQYGEDWVEVADSQAATDEYRLDLKLPPLPSLGGGGNGAGSAALAGGRDDPEGQTESHIDRETRLVGALMRGDETEVEACLMEFPHVRSTYRPAARP